jgi:hypothetical protein
VLDEQMQCRASGRRGTGKYPSTTSRAGSALNLRVADHDPQRLPAGRLRTASSYPTTRAWPAIGLDELDVEDLAGRDRGVARGPAAGLRRRG